VLEVDQTPDRQDAALLPATYVGFWDAIRRLFAEANESRMRGWSASRFRSTPRAGAARSARPGNQENRDELPAGCEGHLRGLRGHALQSGNANGALEGKIDREVLAMSVDEAVEFFAAHPRPITRCDCCRTWAWAT